MAHIPINHPMRPLYRALGALAGLYILIFGIVGVSRTSGNGLFARPEVQALGLRTNMAFSVLSIAGGVIIVVAAVVGRNIDRFVNLYGGWIFLIVGMAMLALLRTDANFLNFSVATCVVSFVIGIVLLTAGLYGKVGSADDQHAEEALRHGV